VIHMGLLNIIRRMHLRQKLSIREIARLTGVSRNTVTKHLAANTIEPKFATPERQSKIDPFAEKLAGWLKTEAGKSRKQKRTMKQLHADLVTLGFTGSYARVAAFATDHGVKIVETLIADLRKHHLVLPSVDTLERLALKGRARARREAAAALFDALSPEQRDQLQALLVNDLSVGQTRLTW